jgi:hypothetical protein
LEAENALDSVTIGPDRVEERMNYMVEMVQPAAATARPAIDFDAAGGIDLERLGRSLQLRGERIGHGRYRVVGGRSDHWVDLYTTAHPRCDCGDHLWRERICKHILAALLREGNERVVAALGTLFAQVARAA